MLTRLFLLLIFLWPKVSAFQVLPYVHIDYEYYYRLATCESQCTEKYGNVGYRRRLDGSTRSFINTTNAQYNMCNLGCQSARSAFAGGGKTRSTLGDDAFKDGQQFWLNGNKKSTLSSTEPQTADRSPVASLKILCLKPASSAQANGFMDTYNALLSAQPHKLEFLAPVRYLIQWKQRIPLNSGGGMNSKETQQQQQRFDETKWITASIEPDSSFTAEGLQPGVQYRFMVTVISTTGRMGGTVTSDWIEAPPLGAPIPTIPLPLVITPQFNSDDNVSAVVSFRREGPSNRRMSIATTCFNHLRYTNTSQQVYSFDFEMDESEGFLLTNLAFNTPYDLELQPLANLPQATNSVLVENGNKGASSNARFRTIACADVFGGGSLQCDPEPVRDLDIRLNDENATVFLTWKPSTEPKYVLLYELRYIPVTDQHECSLTEATMYLPAKATHAEISLPDESRCEVEVYLTNFDLRGREASITARFIYNPKDETKGDNSTFFVFDSLSTNVWIIVLAPILVIITLLIVLRFAANGQRRLKKKVGGFVGANVKDERNQGSLKIPLRCSQGGVPEPVNV